jgi:hypothetical protein
MPYFTGANGDYPYRPRKQADPVFRQVRESAERAAASVAPAGPSELTQAPLAESDAQLPDLEAG